MLNSEEILQSDIFDFPVFPLSENILKKGEGNQHGQLLICYSGEMGPELHAFLEKVMASVGVDIAADALVVPVGEGALFSFSMLDQEKRFARAVFFGISPSRASLNLDVQLYQPVTVSGKTFLFADSLDGIRHQPKLKRPLWEALKLVFGD